MVNQITKAAKTDAVEETAPEAPAADPAPAVFETPAVETPVEIPVEAPATIEVFHNSTFIEWPTDLWGMTTEIKEAFVRLASRIQGAADKKRLADQVINIGRLHLEAKFSVDAKVRQAAIEAVIAENEAKEVEEPAQKELF